MFLLAVACRSTPTRTPTEVAAPTGEIVLLHTSDEHGWIETVSDGQDVFGGPPYIATLWDEQEGRTRETHLTLSSGDSALGGAAISQWFDGIPTIEVMNALGYDAAAIGNHEFDQGREGVEALTEASAFPWLAANIVDDDGLWPPFVGARVFSVGDIDVGVIGIANPASPGSDVPGFTDGLVFSDAAPMVELHAREMRDSGAEVVVVLSHLCADHATAELAQVQEPVDVWLTGHCHRVTDGVSGDTTLVGSGACWEGYGRVSIQVTDGVVSTVAPEYVDVSWGALFQPPVEPDADVQAIVDVWAEAVDEAVSIPIGHTNTGIDRSWIEADPLEAHLDPVPRGP